MNTVVSIPAAIIILAATQLAGAIEYKKNTISGGTSGNLSTVSSFSSSTSINGSNTTTTITSDPGSSLQFGEFDWDDRGFGRKTLDQRIRDAEQRLNKLYFIRDVCRKLEDEIRISFEKKEIREVMKQVSETIGVKLPYEVPAGTYIVEKSDVSGMPADQFLSSVASVCGLTLRYERDKLVFVKPEMKPGKQQIRSLK